jgi:hypothetical protein
MDVPFLFFPSRFFPVSFRQVEETTLRGNFEKIKRKLNKHQVRSSKRPGGCGLVVSACLLTYLTLTTCLLAYLLAYILLRLLLCLHEVD